MHIFIYLLTLHCCLSVNVVSVEYVCVCLRTDGLEDDRYALQSSSLASPMRSPQSYSPSVHLHQVNLLFQLFYSVQRGVSTFWCLCKLYDFFDL